MSLQKLIRDYRILRNKEKKISSKISSLQDKKSKFELERHNISKESGSMKTIIDFCIETGLSPEQAKLSYTLEEMGKKQYDLFTSESMVGVGAGAAYYPRAQNIINGIQSQLQPLGGIGVGINSGLATINSNIGNK